MTTNRILAAAVWAAAISGAAADTLPPLPFPDTGSTPALRADEGVTTRSLARTEWPGTTAPAVRVEADLTGLDAQTAGVLYGEIALTEQQRTAYDTLSLHAEGAGSTRLLRIHLFDAETSTAHATAVGLRDGARRYEVPLSQFAIPARVPEDPPFRLPARVQVAIEMQRFGDGQYSALLGPVTLEDHVPSTRLRIAAADKPLRQREVQLTIIAAGSGGSPNPRHNGPIFLAAEPPDAAMLPRRVHLTSGTATVTLWPHARGPLTIRAYDPAAGREESVTLTVGQEGLGIRTLLGGFEGTNHVIANQRLRPRFTLDGAVTVPLSAHFLATDHRGRTLLSRYAALSDLAAAQAELIIPVSGWTRMHVRLLAEPISSLPHNPGATIRVVGNDDAYAAELAAAVPTVDGTTTDIIGRRLVFHDPAPDGFTILGEDRFEFLCIVPSPIENTIYRSPFGIASQRLATLTPEETSATGARRLAWHRFLGAHWSRDWLPEDSIFNSVGQLDTSETIRLTQTPRWFDQKVVAVLEPSGRAGWDVRFREFFGATRDTIAAYEISPGGLVVPPAGVDEYRSLLSAAHRALRALTVNPRLVACNYWTYDAGWADAIMRDGGLDWFEVFAISYTPQDPVAPPERNGAIEVSQSVRSIMRREQAAGKERWFVDTAWNTSSRGCTTEDQANYLVRTLALALEAGTSKLFWSHLEDTAALPWEGTPSSHEGLLDSGFRPKHAAAAWNLACFHMAHMDYERTEFQGQARITRFEIIRQRHKQPALMYIAWTPEEGDEETIQLDMVGRGRAYAVDYLGAEVPYDQISGPPWRRRNADDPPPPVSPGLKDRIEDTTRTIRLRIGHEPVYIWDVGG